MTGEEQQKMRATGNWLSVEVKNKRDDQADATSQLDTDLVAALKDAGNRTASELVLDPVIGPLLDKMYERFEKVFVISEFETQTYSSAYQKSKLEKVKQTRLAQAIAAGLAQTAVYLKQTQTTEPGTPAYVDVREILEILLNCFPQDQTGPVQAAAAVLKFSGITPALAIQILGESYLSVSYGPSLVRSVQRALEAEMIKFEDDDDVPMSALSKKKAAPAPTSQLAIVSEDAAPELQVDVDTTNLPPGSPIPSYVKLGHYFYRFALGSKGYLSQELYENWVVSGFVGESIVVLTKPGKLVEGAFVDVVYLIYRDNPFGKKWHVLIKIGSKKRLYAEEMLEKKPELLDRFSTIWTWNGNELFSRISYPESAAVETFNASRGETVRFKATSADT